ncbi:cysteine-rich CWC family protein [Ideonella sp. B508-1]|uniref:cysteine-rich CWC family protein n=1 Tax=Ideonella sp. B508-1 TaxID=137716 RepID=UPI0003474E0E|nr:cysteine-rich CWC family protein [Ideonella sp. B508-1]
MGLLRNTTADDRCPRCGGAFHCGVQDSTPCPCSTLTLSAELQAALRTRYSGCLCLACLKALAAGAPLEPPAA